MDTTTWNMAQHFYDEIHMLRVMKSKAFLEGNMHSFKDCLDEIFAAIQPNISKDEIKRIKDYFVEAQCQLDSAIETTKLKAKLTLRKVDIEISVAMHKHNMFFAPTTPKGIKALKQKYKMGADHVKTTD